MALKSRFNRAADPQICRRLIASLNWMSCSKSNVCSTNAGMLGGEIYWENCAIWC